MTNHKWNPRVGAVLGAICGPGFVVARPILIENKVPLTWDFQGLSGLASVEQMLAGALAGILLFSAFAVFRNKLVGF